MESNRFQLAPRHYSATRSAAEDSITINRWNFTRIKKKKHDQRGSVDENRNGTKTTAGEDDRIWATVSPSSPTTR